MNYVYLLQHVREYKNGDEDIKIIGIYSSNEKAAEILEKYKNLEGFKVFPDGFYISKYELNKSFWEEGFTTVPID